MLSSSNLPLKHSESHSEHASQQSMSESMTHLEQRVFVREQQQNNKLLERLKDLLKFERQTVQTQINELRNPAAFKKATPQAPQILPDNDLVHQNEQLKQRVKELESELTSMHVFYKKKLEEQANKSNDKNEFFLHLIDQLHNKHTEEVEYYRGVISDFQQERRHITNIEVKMGQIGAGIEDIVKESSELSRRNQQLEQSIGKLQHQLKEKQSELTRTRELLNSHQSKADEYEKLRLRGIKYQRDLHEMLDEAEQRLQQIPTKDYSTELCQTTGATVANCAHCRLSNMEGKYSKASC